MPGEVLGIHQLTEEVEALRDELTLVQERLDFAEHLLARAMPGTDRGPQGEAGADTAAEPKPTGEDGG